MRLKQVHWKPQISELQAQNNATAAATSFPAAAHVSPDPSISRGAVWGKGR